MSKFVVVFSLFATLTACGSPDGPAAVHPEDAAGSHADHGRRGAPGDGLRVVAAVYPLAWLAEQVAPGADVTLLNAGGSEAHDLAITPAQRAAIETADVVLFMGGIGYQPQVEAAVAASQGEVVDVAEVAGQERLRAGSADPHDNSDGSATDPHLWFDMAVMADVAARTGKAFAVRDAGAAKAYVANAQTVAKQFADLGTDLDALLGGDCQFDEIIVSHVAYTYLTEPRRKELHGITGINPEAGASGGALARLVEEIREEGFRHVVAEPVEGRADAEALAREAGVELLDISPLDAVTDKQAASGFPELVWEQARTLATAYGCA